MSRSAVSVRKVDRLGKRTIVPKVDRAVVSRQGGAVKHVAQQTVVLGVPPAGGPPRFLDGWMGLPGGQVVEEIGSR